MAFSSESLSVMAYANGFTMWHYRAPVADNETVLFVKNGTYFAGAIDLMRKNDLLFLEYVTGSALPSVSMFRVNEIKAMGVTLTKISS